MRDLGRRGLILATLALAACGGGGQRMPDGLGRNGPYSGLMQIAPQTARTMGHRGSPDSLLDADTNLRYGVKYLRGAWMVAEGDPDDTVKWYSRGYYYEAKRKGLLEETGLR